MKKIPILKFKYKCPFKKGDCVEIIDHGQVYVSYSQFIKRHPQFMLRWAYRADPNDRHYFTVLGIYKHVIFDKYDQNKYIVVIQSNVNYQIFLIGETGLTISKY